MGCLASECLALDGALLRHVLRHLPGMPVGLSPGADSSQLLVKDPSLPFSGPHGPTSPSAYPD